jgi:hypothetical protein
MNGKRRKGEEEEKQEEPKISPDRQMIMRDGGQVKGDRADGQNRSKDSEDGKGRKKGEKQDSPTVTAN